MAEAHDYASALAATAQHRPSHVVLDLNLPGKGGLQLLQALRRLDAKARVVVLTGYGSIATALQATQLGAVHYLVKPVDVDELWAAFHRNAAQPLAEQPSYPAPTLARAEWEHINRVLADSGANISEAARRLKIHRRSLQRKLQKYPPPN